ncbi:transglutaminase domain-containing protein [Hanstruepera flava]|uniref:transglutaminase domain-containing protein n=1 Tax=Hanstruepera flava TaxID=2930218 RepID=UPI002028EA2B|nr:transglutaminase domain-containing protein [Hanstruepera flava]
MKFIILALFFVNFTFAQVSDFESVDFTLADHMAKINKGASLDHLPNLSYNLTHKLQTDVEKFRAIYTWVCKNIKADINQENTIFKKKRKYQNDSLKFIKWNNQYLKTVFGTLLKDKKTMCTGYAYLIKELCLFANIECEIINGYGRSITSNVNKLEIANHSWNAVKLNDKWYLCDATWSSGYTIGNTFMSDFNDGYFLTDPILFSKSHYPLQEKWLLIDSLTPTQFTNSPLIYSESFKHKIIPINPNEMHISIKRNHKIDFSFKSLKQITNHTISLIKYNGIEEITFEVSNLKNENGTISFDYTFKRKGLYDVHLKINNDIVATYVIQVS